MTDIEIKGKAIPFTQKEIKELALEVLSLYTENEIANLIIESGGTDMFFAGNIANSIHRKLKKAAYSRL